jgi:hypothetical protein
MVSQNISPTKWEMVLELNLARCLVWGTPIEVNIFEPISLSPSTRGYGGKSTSPSWFQPFLGH